LADISSRRTPSFDETQLNPSAMPSRIPDSPHTIFNTEAVPQALEDSHYGLRNKYIADRARDKLDLVIGAYRDGDGKPWVLPVVKKVSMHNASSTSPHVSTVYLY
jgi:hypothetical protein